MNTYSNVTRYNIEEKLSGEFLKVNRIISSALFIGTLLFLAVTVFLYLQKSGDEVILKQNSHVDTMIPVLLILAIVIYSLVYIFPKIFLKKESLEKKLSEYSGSKEDAADVVIAFDRTLMIIRLAQLEAVTLFATVILLLSVLDGLIYFNSNYWLLVIPEIIFGFIVVTNYLPKEKVVSRIENLVLPAFQDLGNN